MLVKTVLPFSNGIQWYSLEPKVLSHSYGDSPQLDWNHSVVCLTTIFHSSVRERELTLDR